MFEENDPWLNILTIIKKYYYVAPYNRDIESEIMDALAQEITAEIDKEILDTLMKLPGLRSQKNLVLLYGTILK